MHKPLHDAMPEKNVIDFKEFSGRPKETVRFLYIAYPFIMFLVVKVDLVFKIKISLLTPVRSCGTLYSKESNISLVFYTRNPTYLVLIY